jgi:uncharacterized membrane protein
MKLNWLPFHIKTIFKGGKVIKYRNITIFITIIFAILFSVYSILKAYTFNASAWDLGLYSQVFYSSLHGQLFYTNLLGESYLAEHFSPFVFLIVPFFYLYPSPYTLLVIQAVFLSIATIPLYYISLHIFTAVKQKYPESIKEPSFYSFIIAIAFLLSPLTESPIYFDFHLMIFLPFFYFMAIYFYLKNKIIWNIVFLALIVSLHSSFIFIVAATLLMQIMISKYYINEPHIRIKKMTYLFMASLIILLLYYTLAGYLKGNIAQSETIALFTSGASGAATRSIFELALTLFSNPVLLFRYIVSNYQIKLLFLVLGFMGVDFAFYRFPIGIIPAVPYFIYAMTSSYIPYYFIGYQYSMMLIPIVFVAGVFGISKMMEIKPLILAKAKHARKNLKYTMVAIVAFAVAAFIVVSPISPLSVEPAGIHNIINDSTGCMEDRNQLIYSISKDINMNSSLITGNNIFPLFYRDMNATAFPYNNISSYDQHFTYLIANFNDSQTYTKNGYNISLANLASHYMNDGDYGIIAEGYGVIALELNYSSSPIIFKPFNISYEANEFVLNNQSICGPVPDKGLSSFQKLENTGGNIYSGNTTYLLPGNYSISLVVPDIHNNMRINITIFANNGKQILERVNSTQYKVNQNTIIFHYNNTGLYTGVIYKFNGINSINSMSINQESN